MKSKQTATLYFFEVLLIFTFFGCAGTSPSHWKSDPEAIVDTSSSPGVYLRPVCRSGYHGCNSFLLGVINNTNENVEINWNKTLYISEGQTAGSFMFEGVPYMQRNNPKSPDIVFGKSKLIKIIYPNILAKYAYNSWSNSNMPEGENGVYLSLLVDGKEVNKRLQLNLFLNK